ncbi:MAG: porin [Opitutaceae bacterium]
MFHLKAKWLALLGGAILAASPAMGQDQALINILIKKGILNEEEAKQITKELVTEDASSNVSTSGSKFIKKLTISGRIQSQYAGLSTNVDDATIQPNATGHFFLRRIYLGAKAEFGQGWSGNLNYDFASTSFDAAFIQWKQSDQFVLDMGFRKAPIGLEEWDTSSGSLKAIERSPITRYFVESNNGRRLGAGSYRTGVFVGGTNDGFFYNVAITNPERDEFSSLNGNSDPGVQAGGTAANNNLAYWGNVGYKGKFTNGSYRFGTSVGMLPDQGGLVLGKGDDLTVYSIYGVLTAGNLDLEGEYFGAKDDHGISASRDASPTGYWIQPAYKFTDKIEGVIRYSYVDSDGRGVNLSDGTRSAPSGGTMDKMSEWYFGGNYFFRGNDVKLQVGYIHAESKDTVTGAHAQAKADGLRSQIQVNF